jgi:integrase
MGNNSRAVYRLGGPTWIFKRGRYYYFRHKPANRKEICRSLRTTNLDRARRSVRDVMSRLQVHESTRSMAQCIFFDLVKCDNSIKQEIQTLFPGLFQMVKEKTKLSKWRDEFIRLKNIGNKSLTYPMELQYKNAIDDLILVVGDKYIEDVAVDDIDLYVEMRSDEDATISPRTLVNKFKLIKSCFAFAERKGVVQKNVVCGASKPECNKNNTESPPFELVDALCDFPKIAKSRISDVSWRILPYCFRYTGCRLNEICGMTSESIVVEDGIPCIRVKAGKADLRKNNKFPGGIKTIPVHPRLWDMLRGLRGSRSELLFPDSGVRDIGDKARPYVRHGFYFSMEYNKESRKIWQKMHVHAWRSYVCSYLTKVAMVPEIVSSDIAGHATGTVHRDYAGFAPLRIRYEAVCKLP